MDKDYSTVMAKVSVCVTNSIATIDKRSLGKWCINNRIVKVESGPTQFYDFRNYL